MKLPLLTLLLMGSALLCFGQNFKNDWNQFSSTDFTIKVTSSPTVLFGRKTQGELIFVNKKDSIVNIAFPVFLKSDVDSILQKGLKKMWQYTGCVSLAKVNFSSFQLGSYYYAVMPCHKCNTRKDKACEELTRKIASYVTEKK